MGHPDSLEPFCSQLLLPLAHSSVLCLLGALARLLTGTGRSALLTDSAGSPKARSSLASLVYTLHVRLPLLLPHHHYMGERTLHDMPHGVRRITPHPQDSQAMEKVSEKSGESQGEQKVERGEPS